MIKFTDKMLCALSTRGRYVAARRMYTYNPAEKVVHVWERNVELGDFEEVARQRYDVEAHIAMRGCKVFTECLQNVYKISRSKLLSNGLE